MATPRVDVSDRPRLEGLEQRWSSQWEATGVYRFDRTATRDRVYAIDTPPPTVSGDLHAGHLFSYTHTDLVARFQRMRGREVFYPMGWDDNGLNTERRVQLLLGITCDPSRSYDPAFEPPGPSREPVPTSRRNFTELCSRVTAELERAYRDLWTTLGLSVDWQHHYTTIGPRARRVSQDAFLRLLRRGLVARALAPTLWDVDFRTAVAQAELEEREVAGAWHRLRFTDARGDPLVVDTTRPELLPACVAVVVHPDDGRYGHLVGERVTTPLFHASVPVHAHRLADPKRGTGAVMVCTFGDVMDITWWRELRLPVRPLVGTDGRVQPMPWGSQGWPSRHPVAAARAADGLTGLATPAARDQIVGLLRAARALEGEPRPVRHTVPFWEHGSRPLEIVTSWQWFVATARYRDVWRRLGEQLRWHPESMHTRFLDWVEGLTGDWNISRQRFFGVPFPLWYPIGDDGAVDREHPLTPRPEHLPVDPTSDVPDGYVADQRDRPGGFTAETDVMDTWATSSLTPQIAGGWPDDPHLFGRVFPMDLRPQAHEIIRTWLFTTMVRAHFEHGQLPWLEAAISGFVVDPDRKKLSKSAGNAADAPAALLSEFGADAVRYWAAGAPLGSDTTLDRNRMKVGRRLALKLLNVSRFVLGAIARTGGLIDDQQAASAALDRAWLAYLEDVVTDATAAFERLDHAAALRAVESAFWVFCDDHVELVKDRAYGDAGAAAARSAHRGLAASLDVLQRLLAPFLPYASEEAWSWWRSASIHRAPWPVPDELFGAGAAPEATDHAMAREVLREVRRAKAAAQAPMRTRAEMVAVVDSPGRLVMVERVRDDLARAGRIDELQMRTGDDAGILVRLAGA